MFVLWPGRAWILPSPLVVHAGNTGKGSGHSLSFWFLGAVAHSVQQFLGLHAYLNKVYLFIAQLVPAVFMWLFPELYLTTTLCFPCFVFRRLYHTIPPSLSFAQHLEFAQLLLRCSTTCICIVAT